VGLSSDDFDAFLHVGRRTADGSLANATRDDDGGGGTSSLVEYVADEDGPVTLRVNTLAAGETGAYSLELYSTGGGGSPDGPQPAPEGSIQALRVGQSVRATLAQGDATLDDGSWYDAYTYTARRGERVVVRMESDDFDTVLGIGTGSDDADDLVMDDDGGGGTNSRVEFTATRDGTLYIRANALFAGEGGAYTIVVESARSSALPRSHHPDRLAAAPVGPSGFAAPAAAFAAIPSALRSEAGTWAPAASAFAVPPVPRLRADPMSSRFVPWGMAALGIGMIFAGAAIEDTPAEPLGALVRYTGYAVIVFAPFSN
jgi:hypothetical protein